MQADSNPPRTDLARAVDALLQADPARITALLSRLRAPGRFVESTIQGMSMGRNLPPGSRIRIALVECERFTAGEVIAFLVGNRVVVHRVLFHPHNGSAAGFVLTRGDAPLVPDPPVPTCQILGPVTGVWVDGHWKDVPGPMQRSAMAMKTGSLLLLAAQAMLPVSPRLTTNMLLALHRAERALRVVRNRRVQQQLPAPPGTV